jgi:hypothetical protein
MIILMSYILILIQSKMFERFILASSLKRIENRFNKIKLPETLYLPSFNIRQGSETPVFVQGQNHRYQKFSFAWHVKNRMECFIRAEGNKNLYDDPGYSGSKAIFLQPEYRKAIRYSRCIVPADAFVVKNSDDGYYLVFLQERKRPFAFAGICSESTEGGQSFAIITVPANPLLTYLNQKRMPVILDSKDENRWLKKDTTLARVLQCLSIYPANLMNAYPIAAPSAELNDVTLVEPAGDPLYQEQQEFRLQARKPKKAFSSSISFSDRRKTS